MRRNNGNVNSAQSSDIGDWMNANGSFLQSMGQANKLAVEGIRGQNTLKLTKRQTLHTGRLSSRIQPSTRSIRSSRFRSTQTTALKLTQQQTLSIERSSSRIQSPSRLKLKLCNQNTKRFSIGTSSSRRFSPRLAETGLCGYKGITSESGAG